MKKESSLSQSSPQWFMARLLGPGMKIALLIIAVLLIGRALLPHQVPIERRVLGGKPGNVLRNPTTEFLLMNSAGIGLSVQQRQDLTKTEQDKDRALLPADFEVKTASEQFSRFMQRNESRGLNISQIQNAAQALSAASEKQRLVAKRFDDAAWALLKPQQKAQALRLWDAASVAERGIGLKRNQIATPSGDR